MFPAYFVALLTEFRTMSKHIAVYVRCSSKTQDTASQEPELQRWLAAQSDGAPVVWYSDTFTGKTMDRPGMQALLSAIGSGQVSTLLVWRLDRLGRTARGLTALFDDLQKARVNLVSMKDGLDLSTPAGRLMANVLASVAMFETEIRKERQAAGIAAARAAGKRWGGRPVGTANKLTPERLSVIRDLKAKGESIAGIARTLSLSRPTVYAALRG